MDLLAYLLTYEHSVPNDRSTIIKTIKSPQHMWPRTLALQALVIVMIFCKNMPHKKPDPVLNLLESGSLSSYACFSDGSESM